MIGAFLGRMLEVWRPVEVPDGSGGVRIEFEYRHTAKVQITQPTANEELVAAQWGSTHSHNVYLLPDESIRRGDELRDGPKTYRVLSVVQPSKPAYLKCRVEARQSE